MTEQISDTMSKLKNLFQKRYNEEIDEKTLTTAVEEYGEDRVEEVITNMKQNAYAPASFMKRSLSQGWYTGKKPTSDTNPSLGRANADYVAKNTTSTWNRMVSLELCSSEDAEYMINVITNGVERDENRIQDINFRIRQGLYPQNPAAWFYWLPFPKNRRAANQWMKDNNVSDIPLYDI